MVFTETHGEPNASVKVYKPTYLNLYHFQAYAVQQCQGKSECRIEAKNSIQGEVKERQDPCVGIPKYTQVVWTCGDYDEPANPYLGPNDKGFEVACENKNKQFGPSGAEMVFFILLISNLISFFSQKIYDFNFNEILGVRRW